MLNINPLKVQIKTVIVNKLTPIEGLSSITFVGSFESSTDISLISDIDIIVIVDELSEIKFREIEKAAGSIKGVDIGLDDYKIKLNMTFGPLKFNNENTVIFHIMVYDIVGHRKHVLESPFTCLDWEFFPAIYGKNLSDIDTNLYSLNLKDDDNLEKNILSNINDNKIETYLLKLFNSTNYKNSINFDMVYFNNIIFDICL